MPIENIIFDIDEVLYDTMRHYIDHCNAVGFPVDIIRKPRRAILDFRAKPESHREVYYNNPMWRADAHKVLHKLYAAGIKLFTLSRGNNPARKAKMITDAFGDIITPYGMLKHQSKLPSLRKIMKNHGLDPSKTLLVDDSVEALRSGIRAGMHVARMMGEFTLPSPADMRHIPHIKFLSEVEDLI